MVATRGMMMMAATVCETNTPTKRTPPTSSAVISHSSIPAAGSPSSPSSRKTYLAIILSKPESCTARPSALPPAMSVSKCHGSEFKSSLLRKPEPNATAIRPTPTTAGSPNVCLSGGQERVPQRSTATATAPSVNFFVRVSGVTPHATLGSTAQSSGRSSSRRSSQTPRVPTSATGPATELQRPNETSAPTTCCSATIAIAFCGDAIGVIIPPRLHEKARPSSSAREKRESEGSSCSSGCTTASRSTGAVTFEIAAERRRPSSITARRKRRGCLPSLSCSAAASRSSSWQRATTRAATSDERTRRITALNMEFSSRLAMSGVCSSSPVLYISLGGTAPLATVSTGTSSAVAKKGTASESQRPTVATSTPRQRCASGRSACSKASSGARATTRPAARERARGSAFGRVSRPPPARLRASCASWRSRGTLSGGMARSSSRAIPSARRRQTVNGSASSLFITDGSCGSLPVPAMFLSSFLRIFFTAVALRDMKERSLASRQYSAATSSCDRSASPPVASATLASIDSVSTTDTSLTRRRSSSSATKKSASTSAYGPESSGASSSDGSRSESDAVGEKEPLD
mmetsp:Transcript_35457/g.111329  ORF Transcript_35457/g.111329 Transcript_35457/m.111329 type:complete len:578 (+) Transcript_35457:441-2174(+)